MKVVKSFNNYFANIGITTRQNVPRGNTSYTDYIPVINSMLTDEIDYLHCQNR